jgi:signal transduction histidine kinase
VAFERTDGYCEVSFANDIPGELPENFSDMFELFHTGDRSRGSRSVGLGLYICRDLVRAMNGRIEAEQKEGGIVITVSLPAAADTASF